MERQIATAKSIERAAADWVAKLDAGELPPADEAALQNWLQSDSRCLGALARAQALFVSPAISAAIDAPRRPLARMMPRRAFLAAAAAGIAGAALLVRRQEQGMLRSYSSELGEVRQIALEDGSRLTLNTDSALTVEYRKHLRLITLQRGEAFFEVEKDPDRPFSVVGPHAQARAVGTAYSVRLDEAQGHMLIKVTSGRVAVELPPSFFAWPVANGTYVDANQEATVRVAAAGHDRGQVQVSIRDLPPDACERSLMWREGLLAFEGDSLNDAIAEFARYSRQKIQLQGNLPRERISGLFNAADPAGFARAIAISLRAKIKTENNIITMYK